MDRYTQSDPNYLNTRLLGYVAIGYKEPRTHYLAGELGYNLGYTQKSRSTSRCSSCMGTFQGVGIRALMLNPGYPRPFDPPKGSMPPSSRSSLTTNLSSGFTAGYRHRSQSLTTKSVYSILRAHHGSETSTPKPPKDITPREPNTPELIRRKSPKISLEILMPCEP